MDLVKDMSKMFLIYSVWWVKGLKVITAYVKKSSIKPFVASEEAAWNTAFTSWAR